MGCRTEAANAEPFTLQLLDAAGNAGTGKNALVVRVLHRADKNDVMSLQVGDDDIADGHDRRIAAGKSLNRHLAATEKDQLDIEAIFFEQTLVLGDPELRLARTDRRIADADLLQRLPR